MHTLVRYNVILGARETAMTSGANSPSARTVSNMDPLYLSFESPIDAVEIQDFTTAGQNMMLV